VTGEFGYCYETRTTLLEKNNPICGELYEDWADLRQMMISKSNWQYKYVLLSYVDYYPFRRADGRWREDFAVLDDDQRALIMLIRYPKKLASGTAQDTSIMNLNSSIKWKCCGTMRGSQLET
jgi:hypothetical protein